MPSSRHSIVEPHPTAPQSGYMTTGRGGAGNIIKPPTNITRDGSDASNLASRASVAARRSSSSSSSSSRHKSPFTTGRGGAGNIHPSSERAIFSFDEELEQQLKHERDVAPVYHVGRGGAGNVGHLNDTNQARARSSFADGSVRRESVSSGDSQTSVKSGADVATRAVMKGLKKITGVR